MSYVNIRLIKLQKEKDYQALKKDITSYQFTICKLELEFNSLIYPILANSTSKVYLITI